MTLDVDPPNRDAFPGTGDVTITEPPQIRLVSIAPLTSRQHEVLALTARGLRAKQVAYRLGLSTRTIEKHKQDMMRKLGLRSTIELLRWYLEAHGRTPVGP